LRTAASVCPSAMQEDVVYIGGGDKKEAMGATGEKKFLRRFRVQNITSVVLDQKVQGGGQGSKNSGKVGRGGGREGDDFEVIVEKKGG